jgi:hypothetical protein
MGLATTPQRANTASPGVSSVPVGDRIAFLDPPVQRLAVMHGRMSHGKTFNQFAPTIPLYMIFIPVVALLVLLGPARIQILLAEQVRILVPLLGHLTRRALSVLPA